MNGFRYLDYKTLEEVECMTLPEYLYRMKAYSLQRVDKEFDLHLSAWLNVQAASTESKGNKTVARFKTFKDFFDYEARVNAINGEEEVGKLSERERDLARIAASLNK